GIEQALAEGDPRCQNAAPAPAPTTAHPPPPPPPPQTTASPGDQVIPITMPEAPKPAKTAHPKAPTPAVYKGCVNSLGGCDT
ncbi:hypothetical protein PV11_03565, partial [Exophiala sideris]